MGGHNQGHPVMGRRWLSGHALQVVHQEPPREAPIPPPAANPAPSSWSARAFSASMEGVKDGGALALAEGLTRGIVVAISVEAPMVGVVYANSEIARALLHAAIPMLVGAAASLGWTPEPELVMSTCARALRASVSSYVAPLVRRFEEPLMHAVAEAMRRESDAGRGGGA